MKKYFIYILSLILAVSCLEEERSPEEILVPSPAQVETSDASLMLTSKVPSGSEKLVQECGFYYSKDKSMADTRKVAGVLAGNNFTAELPDRTYGTTYYICSYVTNGHGSEIRSDLRTFQLDELEEYVEFGQVNMVSFDPSSKQLMITIDTDIWAGVSVSEAGVCYGTEPTSLSIEGDHKEGVYRSDTRAEAGVIEILLNNFSEATQYYLRPYVKDGDYLSYGEVVPFYIPAVAKVSTFDAEAVTASGATLSGEVTDECGSAVTERGFAWIEGDAVPTIEDSHMAAGSGLGAMTATVEGLQPNKKYTFRAYATNASGTAYGEAKVFTTLVALPSLAGSTISNITSTSATFNGVLANDGGESVSEVGFYYSTEKEVNPETAQKVSLEYSTYQKSAKELSANTLYSAMQSAQKAASDEGETFSIDVYNLGIKTKYYVKSYAVNSAGVAYGSVVNFETAGEIATIKTVGSSEVKTSSAVLLANITTDNGEKITERGFVWMEGTGNPTTDSNKLKVSGEVGEYTATLEGLDPNKKYSFRAYAINAEGTAYGDVMSFTTKVALPALSNVVIPSLSSTTATLTSKVTYHGGETVTEVGFYYSSESDVDPETSQKVSRLYSEDTFSIEVANLGINTKYYVKAYAINSAGTAYSEINSFKTESSVPSVQTIGVADITPESALLSGSILSDNGASITERGFVWIQGDGTPTVDSHKLTATGTTGEFTSSLTGLEPNKKYSFRAYATNSKGTAYGEIMTFSTVAGLPALSSVDVSAITSTSATFSSTVTDHGGETVSEVGFYYSTDETVDPATSVKVTQKYAKDAFTSQIADLAIFTKYFVKAYATNSAGTAYSDVVEFKTLASTPVVNTVGSSDITFNSATLSGKVLTDNGAAITERGFVWIKGEGTPTTSSNKVKVNGTTGDYTASLSDLDPNVTYSYCAYAINELGTSYGAVMKFETIKGLPTLGPVNVSNVTSTAASFSGSVTGHGGETVSEIGFYYSTDAAVDPSSSVKVNLTYSSDSFSSSVSGLAVNTKYYVKSYARNSVGTVYSGVISFTTLADVPVVNTVGSSDVTSSSAVLSGKVVTDNGATITERGFVWVQGEGTPTTSSLKLTTTGTTGDFSATIKDLAPNQKYSFRAYAINSVGTSYGETKSFTTSVTKPSLNPVTFSSITSTSATFSSKVASHGGATVTEVGFYYSTDSTVDPDKSHKVNRTYSSDSFSISISELAINTKYYVKAYAVNSAGAVYSDVASFTTLASTPVVNTVGSSEISSTGAVLSGTVVTDNGAAITERGFVWLKGTDAPTTSSNKVKVEGATGDFTAIISGLDPNQKYSFRAYAINSKGTAYGDIMTFNTVAGLPALSAMKVSSITTTSATFTCTVTNHGGETVSEVGFYYSKEESIDVETAQKISEVYSSDAFTLKAEDLEIGQNYYVKAYTKNSIGEVYSAVVSFKTTSTAPSVSTIGYTKLSATSAELSGQVLDDNGENITERGFVWVKGTSTPTTSSSKQSVEGTVGDYTVTVTDLEPNQIYSFRAYAINSKGTAYGDVIQLQIAVTLPTVTTNEVTGITNTTATSGGVIVSDGGGEILAKGVVWSMRQNPTLESSNMTNEGEGTDAFTSRLTDLRQGLTYYVRAYATNVMGTSYGEEKQFTTTGEIQGTPLEASNSFIISNAGTYTFQTVKGNSYESVGSVVSAEVLWESFGTDEQPEVGSLVPFAVYKNGKISFGTPDQFREGNAVIAAKDASGTILWSWHIWMTDQPQEQVYYNNAGTMMDRNLGATSATPGDVGALGLLYQWGRKDPFLGSASIHGLELITMPPHVWTNSSNGTIEYATEHPTTFMLSNNSNGDWYYTGSSSVDNTRWQSRKTIYDPCPNGWRVPDGGKTGVWAYAFGDSSYYKAYDSSNEGMNLAGDFGADVTIWYPAAGYGHYDGDSAVDRVGADGYYWSVTPCEGYHFAHYLYFSSYNSIGTWQSDGGARASAFSVRCQKEGTGGGIQIDLASAKDLSTSGTANSYIVSSVGTYSIPTVKGNSSESVGSVVSAEVLWESFGTDNDISVQDLIRDVIYDDGTIYFVTSSIYKEGNAVIAAKDAGGNILWSWHIWLTDEPMEQVYPNNAGTMMDRNLGATSATPGDVGALGLLYQWGRKDPFLNRSNRISDNSEAKSTIVWPSSASSDSSTGTIEYATQYPTVFITWNTDNNDWYYTGILSTDDTRWQSEKTIYDPCPSGWRVPDGGEAGVWNIAGFSNTTYDQGRVGIQFNLVSQSYAWYPSSEYRSPVDGVLQLGDEGDEGIAYGCYWSVTPQDYNAHSLDFCGHSYTIEDNADVNSLSSMSRAGALSVRCFKEGTGRESQIGGGPQYDNDFSTSGARSLSDEGTANSYVVSNSGIYSIPAVKGNSSESVGSVAYAEVFWETYGTDEEIDKGSLVSGARYENGKIYFKTPDTYREGNAVIAAKDASGTILWSWHIWLTDQPQEQVYNNDAGTMMDRNLGATSATPGDVGALGLLYQWGRKDPFLGSSSISSSTKAKSTIIWPSSVSSDLLKGTINYATEHPTNFITENSTNFDWYYTGSSITDNTRWLSAKTIYDPCPVGWRVPDGGENGIWSTAMRISSSYLSNYDAVNHGINFTGNLGQAVTIWYPGSGYRDIYGGALRSGDGRYWSVTPHDYNAYYLFFNSSIVHPAYYQCFRSYGFSVRCQKE